MQTVFLIFSSIVIAVILLNIIKKKQPVLQPATEEEKNILQEHVSFYRNLKEDEKAEFANRAHQFLASVSVTAVETEIDDRDKIFVAAAAIIPIFAFKDWEYRNIHEVLIYPDSFNQNFETSGNERNVLGIVGSGAMKNVMILSRRDLRNGFLNADTKSNAAIHEFVHLVDKDDGDVDGCPQNLLPHKYALPWLKEIHKEMQLMRKGKSDINPYGATNEAEFLAVAAEYFFEQPQLLKKKHPELFKMLEQIFAPQATK